jgi:hypothetical protein
MRKSLMKQVDIVLMLLAPVQELLMLNLGQNSRYDGWGFLWLTPSLQANARIVPRGVGHYYFLTNPFQFIIYLLSHNSRLYTIATGSAKKKKAKRI